MDKNIFNKFFDKIFVINLFDKIQRWKKVSTQFKRRKIKIERFIAIDGRCKTQGKAGCLEKLKNFEMIYNVKIPTTGHGLKKNKTYPLEELVPASSLSIGTILILRAMIKYKWKYILICEDDIELGRNILKKFKQGVKEIGTKGWDVLYLGCGAMCGVRGISDKKSSVTKYKSQLGEIYDEEIYVQHKNDLRMLCDPFKCKKISNHISTIYKPGGTWCYAYSLSGAKKLLKMIKNDAGEHIDNLISKQLIGGKMKGFAFDPPIVMHEGGALRSDSDIPWDW